MQFRKKDGLDMRYKERDGITFSQIGLGTGRFGTRVAEEDAFRMLDYYFEHGGNVLDTARNYYEWVENGHGKSEECLGKWMGERNNRSNICLVTKGGVKNNGNIWEINLSEKKLTEEIKQSMDALRTDYIDVYLLHRDEMDRPVEEIVETMQQLRELGKVKLLGVANWKYERIHKANKYAQLHGMEPFKVIQTWWSLAEYKKEMWNDNTTTHMDSQTYDYLLENSYIGMAYTSQCKGYFQKAIQAGRDNLDSFLRERIETENNIKILNYIKKYCDRMKISPTAVVCGYITNNPVSGIALVSTSNMEQLADIMRWSNYELPREIINELDSLKGNIWEM